MDHVGVDAVMDGNAGNRRSGLQAFLDDLGFKWFEVRASLAHANPGDKGDRVRLKIRGHHRPYWPGQDGVFAGPLPEIRVSTRNA